MYYQALPRPQEAFATCPQLAVNLPASLKAPHCFVLPCVCCYFTCLQSHSPNTLHFKEHSYLAFDTQHMLMKERKVTCSPLSTNHFLLSAISEPPADICPGIRKPQLWTEEHVRGVSQENYRNSKGQDLGYSGSCHILGAKWLFGQNHYCSKNRKTFW